MNLIEATIEEFEQGAWIADLVSLDEFAGSFDLVNVTWTGTEVSKRQEGEHFHTRVIGGKNGLAKVLDDRFYDGSVTVQAAVQQVCQLAGETFSEAVKGKTLTTFQRMKGPAYRALDAIAEAFDLKWWIGRDGKLSMLSDRPEGAEAQGFKMRSDVDSVDLSEPVDVELGGTYDDKPIRHLRWHFTPARFMVTIYFLPFVFRPPVDNRYDAHEDAKVDKDNGDGTIDVIVGGRYGLKKVKLFCGVPHSKVKVDPGDLVTVGYFGGDPQKPYAVAMAQDTNASKEVARKGDGAGGGNLVVAFVGTGSLTMTYNPGKGGAPQVVTNSGTINFDEKITEGSQRLKVGD